MSQNDVLEYEDDNFEDYRDNVDTENDANINMDTPKKHLTILKKVLNEKRIQKSIREDKNKIFSINEPINNETPKKHSESIKSVSFKPNRPSEIINVSSKRPNRFSLKPSLPKEAFGSNLNKSKISSPDSLVKKGLQQSDDEGVQQTQENKSETLLDAIPKSTKMTSTFIHQRASSKLVPSHENNFSFKPKPPLPKQFPIVKKFEDEHTIHHHHLPQFPPTNNVSLESSSDYNSYSNEEKSSYTNESSGANLAENIYTRSYYKSEISDNKPQLFIKSKINLISNSENKKTKHQVGHDIYYEDYTSHNNTDSFISAPAADNAKTQLQVVQAGELLFPAIKPKKKNTNKNKSKNKMKSRLGNAWMSDPTHRYDEGTGLFSSYETYALRESRKDPAHKRLAEIEAAKERAEIQAKNNFISAITANSKKKYVKFTYNIIGPPPSFEEINGSPNQNIKTSPGKLFSNKLCVDAANSIEQVVVDVKNISRNAKKDHIYSVYATASKDSEETTNKKQSEPQTDSTDVSITKRNAYKENTQKNVYLQSNAALTDDSKNNFNDITIVEDESFGRNSLLTNPEWKANNSSNNNDSNSFCNEDIEDEIIPSLSLHKLDLFGDEVDINSVQHSINEDDMVNDNGEYMSQYLQSMLGIDPSDSKNIIIKEFYSGTEGGNSPIKTSINKKKILTLEDAFNEDLLLDLPDEGTVNVDIVEQLEGGIEIVIAGNNLYKQKDDGNNSADAEDGLEDLYDDGSNQKHRKLTPMKYSSHNDPTTIRDDIDESIIDYELRHDDAIDEIFSPTLEAPHNANYIDSQLPYINLDKGQYDQPFKYDSIIFDEGDNKVYEDDVNCYDEEGFEDEDDVNLREATAVINISNNMECFENSTDVNYIPEESPKNLDYIAPVATQLISKDELLSTDDSVVNVDINKGLGDQYSSKQEKMNDAVNEEDGVSDYNDELFEDETSETNHSQYLPKNDESEETVVAISNKDELFQYDTIGIAFNTNNASNSNIIIQDFLTTETTNFNDTINSKAFTTSSNELLRSPFSALDISQHSTGTDSLLYSPFNYSATHHQMLSNTNSDTIVEHKENNSFEYDYEDADDPYSEVGIMNNSSEETKNPSSFIALADFELENEISSPPSHQMNASTANSTAIIITSNEMQDEEHYEDDFMDEDYDTDF